MSIMPSLKLFLLFLAYKTKETKVMKVAEKQV